MNDFPHFLSSSTNMILYNWLCEQNLISETMHCDFCRTEMVLKTTKDSPVGLNFRCLNYSCRHYQTTKSVFLGSFFGAFRLDTRKILRVIFYLSLPIPSSKIIEITGLNKNTVLKIKRLYVSRIESFFEQNLLKLGGHGVIVHVDETMLNHTVRAHR
ncbi:hypothetical protein DMUE_2438 [Dictyocoela muelleri]|nr:hypothetical protein DMUE_2438 [Dictyocoela muelleri]